MRIEGAHKCNSQYGRCDNEYEWMAVIAHRKDSPVYEVETLDKPIGKIIETTDEQYVIRIMCPKCYQNNIIRYYRYNEAPRA